MFKAKKIRAVIYTKQDNERGEKVVIGGVNVNEYRIANITGSGLTQELMLPQQQTQNPVSKAV